MSGIMTNTFRIVNNVKTRVLESEMHEGWRQKRMDSMLKLAGLPRRRGLWIWVERPRYGTGSIKTFM